MITYSTNNRHAMTVSMAQLTTIHNIAATAGRDAIEVVDHSPSPIVEVYVGQTWRHHVEADGTIWLTEKNVSDDPDDYDWQAPDVEDDDEEPWAEVLHEFKLAVGDDDMEVSVRKINRGTKTIACATLGKTDVSIGRTQDGKVTVCIDDVAEEPVYVTINAMSAFAADNHPDGKAWNEEGQSRYTKDSEEQFREDLKAAVVARGQDSNDAEIEALWECVNTAGRAFGIDASDVEIENPCNCESTYCKHPYMSVEAGLSRAMYIGAICDECAKTCMAEYLT